MLQNLFVLPWYLSIGSYATAMMLEDGAHNLMLGGQQEIFTPMYWVLIRKPMTPKKGAAAAAAGAAVPEA